MDFASPVGNKMADVVPIIDSVSPYPLKYYFSIEGLGTTVSSTFIERNFYIKLYAYNDEILHIWEL